MNMFSKPKMERREEEGHWMQGAVKHPGALHAELHVPKDKKIPVKKLIKAEHSKSPLLRKRATLAITFKKYRKGRD